MALLSEALIRSDFSAAPITRPGRRPRGWVRGLILALGLGLVTSSVPAQPTAARDYEVKAGFLVKFTQYAAWPSNTFHSSTTPVVIGVRGGEPLFKQLEREAAAVTGSRPVEVRQLNTVDDATGCHVVYIGMSDGQETGWFDALKGKPILTVGESSAAIAHGAVMCFVLQNKNVRFEASLAAAAENRLGLDERMLRVASRVYKRYPGN